MNQAISKAVEQLKDKRPFVDDISSLTEDNEDFRNVVYTSKYLQIVLMTIPAGEDIGMESHDSDQFIRVEEGVGRCIINGKEHMIEDGSGIVIPSGAKHNIISDPESELKIYVIYGPPRDKDGLVQVDKPKT